MFRKKYFKKWVKYILLLIAFLVIVVSIGLLYLQNQLKKKGEQTFYKSFEIAIPNNYNINGIDVSKYQSYIYWNSVKEMKIDNIDIDFAFVKATEGLADIDDMFNRNWSLLKQHKIIHGAYHYFIATSDGKQQAKNFIKTVKLEKGNLPPVVDVEQVFDVDKLLFLNRLKKCLSELEKHYRVKPIIYTYTEFYNNYLGEEFDTYLLWVAHYTEDKKPNINRNWTFWQHSNTGRVNGITEKVDFNVFNGDSIAFNKILMQ